MKLYIAPATCSRAPQMVINEAGLDVALALYDIASRTTSTGEDFAAINPLLYVPALALDDSARTCLTEASVIASYLAEMRPETGLIPPAGSARRPVFDQDLMFIATEIAQKHIPLMRGHMNEAGRAWTLARLAEAYALFDQRLADGRPWLAGENFTLLDIYLWATLWGDRTGARIDSLRRLTAWLARVEARPSAQKTLAEEAALVQAHAARPKSRPNSGPNSGARPAPA